MRKESTLLIGVGIVCIVVGIVGGLRGSAVALVPHLEETAQAGTFVVRNARVFDGETTIERASVLVRDGRIADVGPDVTAPAGVDSIDGSGHTLFPGLIDAHTHTFGDALERALVFGVTTELDMFTDHRQAAVWRREQQADGGAPGRADIFSAGTLVTAPKGHGTQFGLAIPTIESPDDAAAFVKARIAEGSDYIKVIYEEGAAHGRTFPAISAKTLYAVVSAAQQHGKLAVVHVGSRRAAETAIGARPDGLVHIFGDEPPPPDFAGRVREAGAFVTPTLSVIESVEGLTGGAELAADPRLSPFLTPSERTALGTTFPQREGSKVRLQHALEATRQLHAAGVPILAGSDAPNPGTVHGATIHRELELLVQAGLTPVEALRAATWTPARAFQLGDRGRIARGLRADLVLVKGDPTRDITATRAIAHVWKGGIPLQRRPPPEEEKPRAVTEGRISDFDDGRVSAAFGSWQTSTDAMIGGSSEARMQPVKPGAAGSPGALEIAGTMKSGAPFPWAGAMFFPAAPPMTPADVSRFTEIVFWARGDGREYQVMVFATRLGNIPATRPFTPKAEWQEFVMPLKAFSGLDGSDLRGILFSASPQPGDFRFAIDEIRLR